MELYDIACVLGSLFLLYVIHQYMEVFYSDCKAKPWVKWLCYGGYFIGATLTHLCLKLPLLVLLVNIIFLTLLALAYGGGVKKALLTVALLYITLLISEVAVATLNGQRLAPLIPYDNQSVFGLVQARLLSLMLVLLIKGFKKIKGNFLLPKSYWVSLLVIPTGNVVMLLAIFTNENLSKSFLILCIGCVFLVNIVSFYLYDAISGLMQEQLKQCVMEEENRFYEYQVQMMKDNLESMRTYRHDLKNKLSPLCALAEAGQKEELIAHLSELTEAFTYSKEYSHSGNITVDSIINYKLQQSENEQIRVSTDILIPTVMDISTFDIAVILGNLLDNALEAVVKIEDRWININIRYTKGRLIIEIVNSYDGIFLQTKDGFISQKADRENHGLGLKSVGAVLEKYDGTLQISNEENIFKTKVLLYL